MRLVSPLAGTIVLLGDVPDPVFADGIVGPGIAIEPLRSARQVVRAPADGIIGAVHPHAFALELTGGRTILVHLGIDTVSLKGLGFTVQVTAGQVVVAGEPLLTWSPVDVSAAGLATICPVIALQAPAGAVTVLVTPGTDVAAGDPLLDWAD